MVSNREKWPRMSQNVVKDKIKERKGDGALDRKTLSEK